MEEYKISRKEFLEQPLKRAQEYFKKFKKSQDALNSAKIDRRSFLKGSGLAISTLVFNSFINLDSDTNPVKNTFSSTKAQTSGSKQDVNLRLSGSSSSPNNYYMETTGPIEIASSDSSQNHSVFGNIAAGYLTNDSVEYSLAGLIDQLKYEEDLDFFYRREQRSLEEVKEICFTGAGPSYSPSGGNASAGLAGSIGDNVQCERANEEYETIELDSDREFKVSEGETFSNKLIITTKIMKPKLQEEILDP